MELAKTAPGNPLPPEPPPAPARVRIWPHAVQSTLVVIVASLVGGLVVHSVLHGGIQRPVASPTEPLVTRLDLNRAASAELQLLPGVGPQLAERIHANRVVFGPFGSIDDLRKVEGIGPLTIERLRPYLIVHGGSASTARAESRNKPAKVEKPATASKKVESLTEPIDVNVASATELQKLPGIGPKLSQRIVEARAQNPFKTIDELRRVPGIGPKTMEKVRPFVIASAAAD